MNHKNLIKKTCINACKIQGTRLWSNPVGFAYNGELVRTYTKGGVKYGIIKYPRPVTYGLTPGSPDTIGFHTVDGKPIFTAIEIKTPHDAVRQKQKDFIAMVKSYGGFAGILRKEEDISNILEV
jgi:hypothetical protein